MQETIRSTRGSPGIHKRTIIVVISPAIVVTYVSTYYSDGGGSQHNTIANYLLKLVSPVSRSICGLVNMTQHVTPPHSATLTTNCVLKFFKFRVYSCILLFTYQRYVT